MIFGREPAFISALIKAIITFVSLTILPLSDGQQTAVNAFAAALLGFVVAWQVAREKALPLIVGLVEAGVYVAVHFGFNISSDVQASLLALVGAVVALALRDRVVAPVDPQGQRVA